MGQDSQEIISKILNLYFSGKHISRETIDRFHEWFAEESHQEDKYQVLEGLFREMIHFESKPSKGVEQSYEQFCKKFGLTASDESISTKRRWALFSVKKFYRIAAVLLSAMMVAGALYYQMSYEVPATHVAQYRLEDFVVTTKNEGVKYCLLPDSSSIWLNRNTNIVYHSTGLQHLRKVSLEGEAYFQVEKRDYKPFVVEVGDLQATVRGTTFNINASDTEPMVRISLYEGYLDVEKGGQLYSLVAGQELTYDKSSGEIVVDALPETTPRWMVDILTFDHMSSSEILSRISTIYNVKIDCEDSALLDEIITVRFEEDLPLHDLLFFLSKMSNKFYCTTHGETVVVHPKPTEEGQ